MEPTVTQVVDDADELAASSPKGINLRPLFRTASRKAVLILGIAGAVTAAAWNLGAQAPPLYAGNFQMLVEPVSSEARLSEPTTLTRTGGTPDEQLFGLDYPTQLLILKSPEMLSSIVEQVRTRYPKFSLNSLQKGLLVERIGKGRFDSTKIVNVTYQGLNPEIVEFVLKKTADKYLKYSLEERKTRISVGVKFIEEQLPDLQERVGTYQAQLQQLQQQYELIDPTTRGEELYGQVRQLEDTLAGTNRELDELKTLYVTLEKQLSFTPDEALTASTLSENPYRTNLLSKLKEIETQIAQDSAIFKPDSPEMQLLEEQRQNVVSLLERETGEILNANPTSARGNEDVLAFQSSLRQQQIQKLVETANQIRVLEVRQAAIAQTKAAFEQQAQQFPEVSRQYAELKQQLDLTNQTLNQLLAQREKLRVEAAQNNVPWELVSPPQVPRDPSGKPVPLPGDTSKKLLMGVVGGLALGMGAALMLEKLRGFFYTPEDLQDSTPLPLLAVIPEHKPTSLGRNRLAFLKGAPSVASAIPAPSPFLESFDTLYANLRFVYASAPIRSLAICSAQPGDGKSTVALHLALTAANMGQRVLLVDANLRQPQLHTLMNLPNRKGLSELLDESLGASAIASALVQRCPSSISPSLPADDLFVLTAGSPNAKSVKFLGSARMEKIAAELQADFDLVVYDTPDLSGCMDAIFLAAHTDGILAVVGLAKTQQSNFMKTVEQLNKFRLPVLGVVAACVKSRSTAVTASELDSSIEIEEALDEQLSWQPPERSLPAEVKLKD